MAKGYWVVTQNNIPDKTKYSAYAEVAKVTLKEFSGKIIIAGSTEIGIEDGSIGLRTIVVELNAYETALAAYHDSKANKEYSGSIASSFFTLLLRFPIFISNPLFFMLSFLNRMIRKAYMLHLSFTQQNYKD